VVRYAVLRRCSQFPHLCAAVVSLCVVLAGCGTRHDPTILPQLQAQKSALGTVTAGDGRLSSDVHDLAAAMSRGHAGPAARRLRADAAQLTAVGTREEAVLERLDRGRPTTGTQYARLLRDAVAHEVAEAGALRRAAALIQSDPNLYRSAGSFLLDIRSAHADAAAALGAVRHLQAFRREHRNALSYAVTKT